MVKYLFRKIIFPLLLFLKTDRFLLLFKSKRCVILNFHGVSAIKGNRFNNRHIDVSEFEKLISYLRKNFTIVALSELFEIYREKKMVQKKTIAITFDDGYLNNFTEALPILKKYQVPATFYIISESLVKNDFIVWPDMIDLIQVHATEDLTLSFGKFNKPHFQSYELKTSLSDFLKQAGEKRDDYLNEINSRYPYWQSAAKKYPEFTKLIDSEKISNYKNESLIEFGSHTHLHYNLEFLSDEKCLEELEKSKKIIEEKTGRPVISIAFPDGSYNLNTLALCKKAGYKNAVAVNYKLNEKNNNPFLLSRFTVSNSTTAESNTLRLARDFDKYGF